MSALHGVGSRRSKLTFAFLMNPNREDSTVVATAAPNTTIPSANLAPFKLTGRLTGIPTVPDGALQIGAQLEPGHRTLVQGVLVDRHGGLALFLRQIHRDVGVAQRLLTRAEPGHALGDTDARPEGEDPAVPGEAECADRREEPRRAVAANEPRRRDRMGVEQPAQAFARGRQLAGVDRRGGIGVERQNQRGRHRQNSST